MRRFRVRITSLIVLVVLVSTGLLLLIGYQRERDSMSEQMEANYGVLADKYAQELTAWINTNAMIINTMSAQITANGIDEEGYEAFHRYLAENCDLLNREGIIYDIYYTYPDNSMVCASDYVPDGTVDYTHERDWFAVAAGTGNLYYSSPYRDSDSGKPIVTISKGVYRNNELQGVLAGDIFVDMLVDMISEADMPKDSYAFLADQNLGMIVHPNAAYSFDDVPHGVMDIEGAPYADVVSKMRSGSKKMVYVADYDGITRGIVVTRMENTGWYVGIATSRAVLMKDIDGTIRWFMIAAVIGLAISAAAAVLLAHVLDKLETQEQTYRTRIKHLESQLREAKKRVQSDESAEPAMGSDRKDEGKTGSGRSKLLVPMLIIFLLMVSMVLYTSRVINNVSVANIHEVGEDRISAFGVEMENYLKAAKSSLWVTADTVDHLIRNGTSTQAILEYITEETDNQKWYFDDNYTGIYGYVQGEYLDGLGWTPPENYDPTRRDWYLAAIEAEGDATIVSPYVDAQTGAVIISISRRLSNGTDVLSLDVMMNHIQEIVSGFQIKEKGYGFIMNQDGMLIAHQDEGMRGRFLTEDEEMLAMVDKIVRVQNGEFEITTHGKKQTVFVRKIMDQWFAVIVVSNQELYVEVWQQLAFNAVISIIIFGLITFFYLLGHRNEQNYSRRIEEMRAEEQRQAYEAQVLKLEKEASDQANRAKSAFLADMSHEIRTPINAVLGMNEIILRECHQAREAGDLSGQKEKSVFNHIISYASNIESAGSNLLSIINDILDFSKIESGRMEIAEGEYQLSSVLHDVSNMIFFRAKEKNLDFRVDVDASIPDGLFGDKVRVRQVMVNVLNNAVKYTEKGWIQLRIEDDREAHAGSDQRVCLKISVTDTGIGIRQEDIEKLFTKFQRVDLNRNSTVEGTGLGLAITWSLLEMMGGSIQVESEYGVGSTFTITLPQRVVSQEPVGDFQTKFEKNLLDAKQYSAGFRSPDAHILVVDDTRMNLHVVAGLLKHTDIRIDTATGGEDAIRLASENAYDLIFMDQRMPIMDGTEALHRIRNHPTGRNRETPVICLTADAIIGAKERYLAEGFTDYLTKPIDSQALGKMLIKYLPPEKVILQSAKSDLSVSSGDETGNPEGEKLTVQAFDGLKDIGIVPQTGLQYCLGDPALYQSILKEYLQDAGQRMDRIRQYYDAGDWKNYGIQVHALKSSSRMIGAAALSEAAAKLESASEQGDVQTIRRMHSGTMDQYRALVDALKAHMDPADDGDDSEILEFLPE